LDVEVEGLVTPYYQDGIVTIYHGDCRDVLPELPRADLLLTDPPYGLGKDGQRFSTGSHGGRKSYDFLGWDSVRPSREAFELALGAASEHIIWGGNYFADVLPRTEKWLIWDKGQRISQSDGELAWTSLPGALRIWTLNRVELMLDGAVHPTQKPLKLLRWCILQASSPQTILDPYMGSGTALRAAKDLGRKAIGIELKERYCEAAARRMGQEVLAV
jgi:site-specific DNA-methyltransferase (adenine-specific)